MARERPRFDWDDVGPFAAIHQHLEFLEDLMAIDFTNLDAAVATLDAVVVSINTAITDLQAEVATLVATGGSAAAVQAAVEAAATKIKTNVATLATDAAADPGPQTPAPVAPVVTGVSPSTGTVAGNDTVTVTGTGFTGTTGVAFGVGNPAASFVANSDTQITCGSPALPAGTVDVLVTTPAGVSAVSNADLFTTS